METVNVGIIGGGLMGREMASAFGRWCAMQDLPVEPRLVAVADTNEDVLGWFEKIPSVNMRVTDYHDLIANPEVDVCYVAVPHAFHEQIYKDVLAAGKDLLAEKPFGVDLKAAESIVSAIKQSDSFVRCSSEFPFFPGPHAVYQACRDVSKLGRVLEVNAGFHHSSDLDPTKPANWKRLSSMCGEIGVLGDLGMHVVHLPFRLGWRPETVYAQLQKGYPHRPGATGEADVLCDTWDNATLHTWTMIGDHPAPMRLEMKRFAPGETNTWYIEVLGTEGGFRYSTKEPKTLWSFERGAQQSWKRTDLGFSTPFKAVTGGIFEVGFPDVIQQMWAAYLLERGGLLGDHFGCVTPEEALASHQLFQAALDSEHQRQVVHPRYA
ncbi:MAG: putative dehydrogenase [Verrucomicrobiales bacterium]|jgi:predicted dehydrogenase